MFVVNCVRLQHLEHSGDYLRKGLSEPCRLCMFRGYGIGPLGHGLADWSLGAVDI